MNIKSFIEYIKESYGTTSPTDIFNAILRHCGVTQQSDNINHYDVNEVLHLQANVGEIVKNLMSDNTMSESNGFIPSRIVAEHLHTLNIDTSTLSNFGDKLSLNDLSYLAYLAPIPDNYDQVIIGYIFQDESNVNETFGAHFTSHLDYLQHWVRIGTEPYTIYRSISTSSDMEELRRTIGHFDGIGRYWTYDRRCATSYWTDAYPNQYHYLLEATVTSNDVDWTNTVFKSLYSLKDEKEIYLHENATPKLLQVWHGSEKISIRPTLVDAGQRGDY